MPKGITFTLHPSIHASLGEKGSNRKNFDKHKHLPHSYWLFLEEAKKGLPKKKSKDQCQVQYMVLCLLTGTSCFSFFFGIQLVALRASKKLHDSFMEGEELNKKSGGTIGNGGNEWNK